jgi:hypothetical protein
VDGYGVAEHAATLSPADRAVNNRRPFPTPFGAEQVRAVRSTG